LISHQTKFLEDSTYSAEELQNWLNYLEQSNNLKLLRSTIWKESNQSSTTSRNLWINWRRRTISFLTQLQTPLTEILLISKLMCLP
jgi:hypothetical protein